MRLPRCHGKDLGSLPDKRMCHQRTRDGESASRLLSARIRPFGPVRVGIGHLKRRRVEGQDPIESVRVAESVGLRRKTGRHDTHGLRTHAVARFAVGCRGRGRRFAELDLQPAHRILAGRVTVECLSKHQTDRGSFVEDPMPLIRSRCGVREDVVEHAGGRTSGRTHDAEREKKGFIVHRAVIIPPYCARVNRFVILRT